MSRRKKDEDGVSSIKVLCSAPHRQWHEFINTDALEVVWLDVNDDTVNKLSLKEWIKAAAWCHII